MDDITATSDEVRKMAIMLNESVGDSILVADYEEYVEELEETKPDSVNFGNAGEEGVLVQLGGQRGLLNKEQTATIPSASSERQSLGVTEKYDERAGRREFRGSPESLDIGLRAEVVSDLKLGKRETPSGVEKGTGNKTTLPDNTTGVRSDAADGGGLRHATSPSA